MNAHSRKQNNHDPSHGLRRWFPSRRRRHDPWLVFNMSTFTFDGQPLHGFNRLASLRAYGVSSAFPREIRRQKKRQDSQNLRCVSGTRHGKFTTKPICHQSMSQLHQP